MQELYDALQTGFIDKNITSHENLQPKLIINDHDASKSVLERLLFEITNCDRFFLCAAFITKSGIAVLLNALLKLQDNGIKGKILVSEYLGFTQPEALRSLKKFTNIELRIATKNNLHGKVYVFDKGDTSSIMIGSSNLTASALKDNNEFNINVVVDRKSSIYESTSKHLIETWNEASIVNEEYILAYEKSYKRNSENLKISKHFGKSDNLGVQPNNLQKDAIKNLVKLRNRNQKKGLIISATGTGKTYLSAFDVKSLGSKRLLFVVHRRNIALKALATYRSLFGAERTYGLYSGDQKDISADFVFATVQTISKEHNLINIDPLAFDYVIIDETHRAGAESYQRVIKYLKPNFLLGMTATPERTDGHDIFADFDHNIAYEIRLHQALQEKILSPFHYFGVTDLIINGEDINDLTSFNSLVSDQRVDHIIEKAEMYGCDDGIVRGLIFCSRKEECIILSEKLNAKGFKTIALTGDDTESKRESAINQLESDENEIRLDYIITVDIFNEGIDIPRVNQIIMLRPTTSAIIFVQQLGRGLRKTDGKNYLTVIDFIGNYQNNYLIPIALYGDTSFNKDKIRRLISSGSSNIPGSSSINFDEIAKKRIFDSIDQSNLCLFRDLKKDFTLLKYEIGRNPMMMDFVSYARRDPFAFVEYSGSYYEFIQKTQSTKTDEILTYQIPLLSAFSKEINNGKRVEESIALEYLINYGKIGRKILKDEIEKRFGYVPNERTIESVFRNLELKFVTAKLNKRIVPLFEKIGFSILEEKDGIFYPSSNFGNFLSNQTFKKYLLDSTKYSIHKWSRAFKDSKLIGGFLLYEKYSRKDVFRILNWEQNPVAQNVGGYMPSKDKVDCAIFVNYDKSDHSLSTKYVDAFLDQNRFRWMSKNKRTLTSPEIKKLQDFKNPMRLPLFVKKSNDEGLDFYYMGEMLPIEESFVETSIKNDDGKSLPVVNVDFKLSPRVNSSIYNYITN